MWYHWHHLANIIEHVLPSAHPSPEPKRQIDRFSRFCTDDRRVSNYFTVVRLSPSKLALPMVQSGPPCNTRFFWPTRVLDPNCISIASAVFVGLSGGSLVWQTYIDRQTDLQTTLLGSITIGRICVRRTSMRRNNA